MSTQKVLICGEIDSQFDLFFNRIETLQNSSAGPFHLLFISGPLFKTETEFLENKNKFILPTYVYDTTGISKDAIADSTKLPINLHIMNMSNACDGIGIATINNLTVAFCVDKIDVANNTSHKAAFEHIKSDIVSAKSYRGCDLFLSNEWPLDCHQFLDTELLISSGISFGPSSKFIADMSMLFIPRYHFAIGKNIYFQRPPYTNTGPSGVTHPSTRFIGLAKVSELKDKEKKYLHALSLTPIIHMSNHDVAEIPIGSTDCPYVPITVGKAKIASSLITTIGSKHGFQSPDLPNKRVKVDPADGNRGRFDSIDTSPIPTAASGAYFFGSMGASRPAPPAGPYPGNRNDNTTSVLPTSSYSSVHSNIQIVAPSNTIRTLFISGVGSQMQIADDDILVQLPGSVKLHRPEGKSFMFVEFASHLDALSVMNKSQKQNGYQLCGRPVTIGWGKDKGPSESRNNHEEKLTMLLEPPSADSRVLFVGELPSVYLSEELKVFIAESISASTMSPQPQGVEVVRNIRTVLGKSFVFAEMSSHELARQVVQRSLSGAALVFKGRTLNVGWSKSDGLSGNGIDGATGAVIPLVTSPPTSDCKSLFIGNLDLTVTEADLLQLFNELSRNHGITLSHFQISKPHGKSYAFVDFYSNEEASSVVDAFGSSSKGGEVAAVVMKGREIKLGWASGGVRPQHAPNDHESNCWFCLASPDIKTHLILSIGEHIYLAIPR